MQNFTLQNISSRLFGDRASFPFEHRLFNTYLIMSFILGIVAAIVNYALNLGFILLFSSLVLSVACGVTYVFSRFRSLHYGQIVSIACVGYLVMALQWFYNGGTLGGVQYLFPVVLLFMVILVKNEHKLLVTLIYFFTTVVLIAIEYAYPEYISMYTVRADRYLDVAITSAYCIMTIGLVIMVFSNNYWSTYLTLQEEKRRFELQSIELGKRNQIIEADLEIARLIQQGLLPRELPASERYDSHAVYVPLDRVGGDFYDIITWDNMLGLFIADVSGHGLASSYLALITKTSLDSIQDYHSPAAVLAGINPTVTKSSVKSNFVTAFFATIDLGNKIIRYASAGHIPQLIFRKSTGEMIELRTTGMPMGWLDEIVLKEKEIRLESGDRIIFFSDGVTECRDSENRHFGEDRFYEFIKQMKDSGPAGVTRQLLDSLRNFSGSQDFEDDITFMVVDLH
ncbi:MAG: PP2C family protein-serine/threonine phosphatase [Spirochaetes bacterium]|jgi:sigma-B regulation protein RsbU (phosphoserine phosphatase)|nr:PP2C family protein-serine/threonine phosphatase [Spirochaetota bacterium]